MAIVFASPKKQRQFSVWIIAIVMVVLFWASSMAIFFNQINATLQVVPMQPASVTVSIPFELLDSAAVKALVPFASVATTFDYTAKTATGSQVSGQIQSSTKNDAQAALAQKGLTVLTLQEHPVGRSNPFTQPSAK